LDLQGLLAWAGGPGPSTVAYGAALERHSATYRALAGSAAAGTVDAGPLALPVIPAAGSAGGSSAG
jgi:hypothetical protein